MKITTKMSWNILLAIIIFNFFTETTSVDEDDPQFTGIHFGGGKGETLIGSQNLRVKRQAPSDDNCQFDVSNTNGVSKCELIINADRLGLVPWRLGVGKNFNWIGGPSQDASESADGGYAFASMADLMEFRGNDTAWMFTTPRPSTDADGKCLKFKYSTKGLSVRKLSVYLITYRFDNVTALDLDSTAKPAEEGDNADTGTNVNGTGTTTEYRPPIEFDITNLLHISDTTDGKWVDGKASFTSVAAHSVAFIATSDTRYSLHRGYVAIDNVAFTTGPCDNDCTFDKDYCTWTDLETDDEFDWSLGRSTTKRGTGPARDQMSSATKSLKSGGYVFIDSGFPRRSGDTARLVSAEITATEIPLCLTFWAHMYGGGIGKLSVLRQIGTEEAIVLWQKEGAHNSRWMMSQLTVTAKLATQYKIIFEADVGERGSGDIAMDTLSFVEGACPQLPPGTSTGSAKADCTFLSNTCEWKLHQPETLTTSFTPMLSLVSGSSSSSLPYGKTQVPFTNVDYYMSFEMGNYKHRMRDSAYLISPTIQNNGDTICLSFWIYMFTTDPSKIKVGSLRVMVVTSTANTTVWRLENVQQSRWEYAQVAINQTSPFQVYIQGTKGTKDNGYICVDDIAFFSSDCELQPPMAYVSPYDCAFNADDCNWKVETPDSVTASGTASKWKYADYGASISVLKDHTFGTENSGYMYIEAYNSDVTSQIVSPKLKEEGDMCLGFYFASFFPDNVAMLNITSRNDVGVVVTLWRVSQSDLPPRPEGNTEVSWDYGQVTIKAPAQAVIQAKVRMGGWAIDDITFTNGTCPVRPSFAAVKSTPTPATADTPAAAPDGT